MANSFYPADAAELSDSQMWESLKLAISESSGFQSWQLDRTSQSQDLDALVHQYLRETLETLAY
ncbi:MULTISPECIES: hypothetical protein [Leptolyngbya]|uniref:hypothetical protein n=1 Tax=Leptolyngbya TaxID=47251 RepID=UPI001682B0CE|nr:hypothetical protein [Leptolyngbya sp. FACHB-1624]MBD1855588.1 hypothetical protein [Leptolyngbya sp. FACHB-1624]